MRVRDGQPPWGRSHVPPTRSLRLRYPRRCSHEDPQNPEDLLGERAVASQRDVGKTHPHGLPQKASPTKNKEVGLQEERHETEEDNQHAGRKEKGVRRISTSDILRKGFLPEVAATAVTSDPSGHAKATDPSDETATTTAGGITYTKDTPKNLSQSTVSDDLLNTRQVRNAFDPPEKHADKIETDPCTSLDTLNGRGRGGRGRDGGQRGRVHEAETTVTVVVKDINDNFPVFPNDTMYAEVQENGPVGKSNYKTPKF